MTACGTFHLWSTSTRRRCAKRQSGHWRPTPATGCARTLSATRLRRFTPSESASTSSGIFVRPDTDSRSTIGELQHHPGSGQRARASSATRRQHSTPSKRTPLLLLSSCGPAGSGVLSFMKVQLRGIPGADPRLVVRKLMQCWTSVTFILAGLTAAACCFTCRCSCCRWL